MRGASIEPRGNDKKKHITERSLVQSEKIKSEIKD